MPKIKGKATSCDRIDHSTSQETRDPPIEGSHSLIQEYQRYVVLVVSSLVRSMALPLNMKEDFVSAGFLGLVEAAERFDPTRGYDFRSYAFLRIRGAVIDYIRKSCTISRRAYRTLKVLEGAQELRELEFESGSRDKLSREQKRDAALAYLSKSAAAFKLLNAGAQIDHERGEPSNDPEMILDLKRESKRIRRLVATLPEKERTIIEQYYFHDLNFTEIARAHSGLSKSWVSRLHDRALDLLRRKIIEEHAATIAA